MGEDGKMYRIDWEKLKPYAGAAAGAAVGMGMAVMGDNPAHYGDAAMVTPGNIVPVMGGLGAAAGMALQHRKQIFSKNKRELPDDDMMVDDMMGGGSDPHPIMPPALVTPSFGGKSKPKPPGFMPRMPGSRRRRR